MPLCKTTPPRMPRAQLSVISSAMPAEQAERLYDGGDAPTSPETRFELEVARKRVMAATDLVLGGEKPVLGARKRMVDQGLVSSELVNHPLYDDALDAFVIGAEDPLADLIRRVAQVTVARVMGYCPDELGFIS